MLWSYVLQCTTHGMDDLFQTEGYDDLEYDRRGDCAYLDPNKRIWATVTCEDQCSSRKKTFFLRALIATVLSIQKISPHD